MRAYETSAGEVPARLGEALQLANAAIANCVEENPALNGMGCTLVGTAFGAAGVEWVSVGDSPMFLVRRGEIFLLNEDHSLAPEIDKLAAAGKMTWEDAQSDPRRHFLRSALTGAEIELIDRSRVPLVLEPGDVVIIASDGIHTLGHADILGVVEAHAAQRTRCRRRRAADGRRRGRRPLPGQHDGGRGFRHARLIPWKARGEPRAIAPPRSRIRQHIEADWLGK